MAYERSISSPTGGWDWSALHSLALRQARAILRNHADAEDAAQAAVLRAWRHRASCRDAGAPEPWVGAIARREALRVAARRRGEDLTDLDDEPLARGDERDHAGALDLRDAVAALPAQDREIFLRHYWGDQSCAQTAAALGMPEGTIKIRLMRGRHRLRARLGVRD